jgi:hypothetical protein
MLEGGIRCRPDMRNREKKIKENQLAGLGMSSPNRSLAQLKTDSRTCTAPTEAQMRCVAARSGTMPRSRGVSPRIANAYQMFDIVHQIPAGSKRRGCCCWK